MTSNLTPVALTVHLVVCENSLAQLYCGKITLFCIWCVNNSINISKIIFTLNSNSSQYATIFLSSLLVQPSLVFLSDGGQVILVYGADYGRHDSTTCSYQQAPAQVRNTYCSNPGTKVAERYCPILTSGSGNPDCV